MMRKTATQKGRWSEELKGKCEREYIVFMDACCENTKRGEGQFAGERGRTDKQMILGVKTCNRWFGFFEDTLPLWTAPCPAVVCPPRLTPLCPAYTPGPLP